MLVWPYVEKVCWCIIKQLPVLAVSWLCIDYQLLWVVLHNSMQQFALWLYTFHSMVPVIVRSLQRPHIHGAQVSMMTINNAPSHINGIPLLYIQDLYTWQEAIFWLLLDIIWHLCYIGHNISLQRIVSVTVNCMRVKDTKLNHIHLYYYYFLFKLI